MAESVEAAQALGTKTIWFNTGTFGRKYTLDRDSQVTVSASKRKDLLNGIDTEVLRAKAKGYEVTINLFAEDKSATSEATDWSYLSSGEEIQILSGFINRLKRENIAFSFFDIVRQ